MPILDWFNKKEALKTADKTPYKVLVENKELSYGDQTQGNMLIKGDNLEALKALLPYYKGRVKCIYIDPPYNTGSAFEHYDDNLEHSTWLSLMYPRLELLRELLTEDGSIFIQIDDNEQAYLKVLMDEIFGRKNFITTITWHKKRGKDNSSRYFSITHDFIEVYAKDATKFYINRIELDESTKEAYTNPDNDPRGPYRVLGIWARKQGGSRYSYTLKNGYQLDERLWLVNKESMAKLEAENRLIIRGQNVYRKLFLTENKGSIPETIWCNLSNNANAKDELKKLFPDQTDELLFDTPKPEPLLSRIFSIATNAGDLILDSFLGSGSTAAVAHKMHRRYIGIEMASQAITHCAPRLKQVIDGTDQGGISKTTNWQGGGGFTFYDLGKPIFDEEGNINHGISFKDLAFHVWFSETKTPMQNYKYSPLLGVYKDTAYYLLYNGVLGDRRVNGGNVLTSKVLESLPPFDGPKVIYGESCRLSPERLKKENIIFKQTPYEITAR